MSVEETTEQTTTTPEASTPPATPDQTAATPSADPSLSAGSETGEAGPSAPEAAPVDPRAEIDALATEYGFQPADLANYTDVAQARAAIRDHVDNLARQGLSGVQQPVPQQQAPVQQQPLPQQQQAPQQVPQAGLDLAALGLDENDPAAKAIRAIEQQVTNANSQAQQIAQVLQQMQNDTSTSKHQQLVGQAEQVISTFQSPEYGVAGSRTASQEWNTQRLFDLADAIAIGAHNAGRPIPPLQARLNQARMIDARDQSPAIGGQPVPAPTQTQEQAQAPAATPLQQYGFATQGNVEPMKMTDSWSANPELMRLINDNR